MEHAKTPGVGPAHKLAPNRLVRFVSYAKRKMDQRAATKATETAADKAARITAQATVWMAVFTFVLCFISVGTLLILRNQLMEMHEGGIDTHALATAADKVEKVAEECASVQGFRQYGKEHLSTSRKCCR